MQHMRSVRRRVPTRVRLDVLRNYLSTLVRCYPTGSDLAIDRKSVNRVRVTLRKGGGGAVLKCRATPIDRIDAALALGGSILEKFAYSAENLSKRPAGCDHLQQLFLASEMGLGALAILNISVDAVPLDECSIFIVERISPKQKPTIFAIMSTQSRFGLTHFARGHDRLPRDGKRFEIVGVNC